MWATILSAVAPWLVKRLGSTVVNFIGNQVGRLEGDDSLTGKEKRDAVIGQALMLIDNRKDFEPEVRTTIEVALSQLRNVGSGDVELRAHMRTCSELAIKHGAITSGNAVRAWLREED